MQSRKKCASENKHDPNLRQSALNGHWKFLQEDPLLALRNLNPVAQRELAAPRGKMRNCAVNFSNFSHKCLDKQKMAIASAASYSLIEQQYIFFSNLKFLRPRIILHPGRPPPDPHAIRHCTNQAMIFLENPLTNISRKRRPSAPL